MSFSQEIKNELSLINSKARCCQISELSALINLNARLINKELTFKTENENIANKYVSLIESAFYYKKNIELTLNQTNNKWYTVTINSPEIIKMVLTATKLESLEGILRNVSGIITGRVCCKRAYLRGCFLAAGSVTSPDKGYHLELTLKNQEFDEDFLSLVRFFDIDVKSIKRGRNISLYIKDSERIAEFLNVCGAVNGYMYFENTKIFKGVRNEVNRLCNCDTANIKKTISASQRQMQAIEFIDDKIGISSLSENLYDVAKLRREYPDLNLEELGKLLIPKLGKSGVNHRLRKLEEIAEELKKGDECYG